jgi:lipoate-protein ligase A
MGQPWRFLPCSSHDGFTNMAIDEAILLSFIEGHSPPTLRLYKFAPAAVTVGLSQKLAPNLVASVESQGFDVVRRPTGGRAVLHLNDLTYSFIGGDSTRQDGFLSTSITTSYKQICQGLIAAFAILGIESELGAAGVGYRHLQDCFLATTGCDLHHLGTKLIGSAQVRRRGAILQHGSVPLNQDPSLMSRILKEAEQSTPRHRNLFDIAGREIGQDELEEAFQQGFAQTFGVSLPPGTLNEHEKLQIPELAAGYRPTQLAPS